MNHLIINLKSASLKVHLSYGIKFGKQFMFEQITLDVSCGSTLSIESYLSSYNTPISKHWSSNVCLFCLI